MKSKVDESEKQMSENSALKARMQTEINELRRILEEKDQINGQLVRQKNSTSQSNDEVRRNLEDETKSKNILVHQVQAAKHDHDLLREQYEEEVETKNELQR